jgi:riboflavin kinase/FMN adenylyltransferase
MFDGVHKGHQKIIKTAAKHAKETGKRSVAVTFDRHPWEVLKPGTHPPLLTSTPLKLKLVGALGVDLAVVIPFTKKFASLKPAQFVEQLRSKLRIDEIVVGENFHFGRGASGSAEFLKKLGRQTGFRVTSVPLVRADGAPISSTRVRQLLHKGDLAAAKAILGRYPLLSGKVVKGVKRGRELGFRTANIQTPDKASLPGSGVFAGYIRVLPGPRRRNCAISMGTAPTFGGVKPQIEVHILGFKDDIYGKEIELEIVSKLRDQKAFRSSQELAEQVGEDIEKAKALLEAVR